MSDASLPAGDLVTPRLRLRPLRRSDAGLIALYCGSAAVARMTTSIPHPYPPGLAESFVERVLSGRDAEHVWALDAGDEESNGLIGLIALAPRDEEAELGYWVATAFWGAGYASEAVEAVVAHAASSGLRAVVAEAFQDNLASVKVLTKAGFDYRGEGARYSVARAQMVPTFRYRREIAS